MTGTTVVTDRVDEGLRSLQRRLVLTALGLMTAILLVACVTVVGLQRWGVGRSVDESLRARVSMIEASIVRGELALGDDGGVVSVEDQFAQVVAADGSVLASSANLVGQPPIAPPSALAFGETPEIFSDRSDTPVEDDLFRVLSRRIEFDGERLVIHAAENVDNLNDGTMALGVSLAAAGPLVLAALAGLLWWLVARAVRPVRDAAHRQDRFVGDASHELRSPLARTRARLEVDLTHPEGVDFRETAGVALEETIGMQSLVDDLLYLARSGSVAGPPVGTADLVDFDDVVLAETAALRPRTSVVVDDSGVSGAEVRGRRSELARVVSNLLDNAIQHAETTVLVRLNETADGAVVLSVEDDGPGIALEDRDIVFDRFTRLDDARSPGSQRAGVGLGLAIAREIVEAHGGTLRVADPESLGGACLIAEFRN